METDVYQTISAVLFYSFSIGLLKTMVHTINLMMNRVCMRICFPIE